MKRTSVAATLPLISRGIELCILSSAHADVAVAVATAAVAVDPDACFGARVSIRIFAFRNVGRFKRTDYVDETTGLHGNIRIFVCVFTYLRYLSVRNQLSHNARGHL